MHNIFSISSIPLNKNIIFICYVYPSIQSTHHFSTHAHNKISHLINYTAYGTLYHLLLDYMVCTFLFFPSLNFNSTRAEVKKKCLLGSFAIVNFDYYNLSDRSSSLFTLALFYLITCVFLFLFLSFLIHCVSTM